jgi:hypothetical protein
MRSARFLSFVAAGIAVLAQCPSASAQSAAPPTAVYAVKFVCGTEAPTNQIAPPAEQNVKPGNYATVINLEYLAFPDGGTVTGAYQVVVDRPPNKSPLTGLVLTSSEPFDLDCADLAKLAGVTSSDPFIIGYVNFYFFVPLNITAIYTSQGCSFGSTTPSTNGGGLRPTTCLGPVSIEVVPQQQAQLNVLPQ